MIGRRDEWSERSSATVLVVACVLVGFVSHGAIVQTTRSIDHREGQLAAMTSWSSDAATGVVAAAPDLTGLFHDSYEVVIAMAPGGRRLDLRARTRGAR
jgi:hypothetical protein